MPTITGSTTTSFGKFSIESLSITNLNGFSAWGVVFLNAYPKCC